MGATIQGYGGSQLSCEANQIVIRLPRQVFGQAWAALVAFLLGASGQQQVVTNSQQVMTRRGAGEDAPRWKQAHLDVFSWLLFLLKVPADHPLVALWQTIPWATINQICAPLYHNAHGGRLAWAPAQMVALLVLMFFYGVTYESRTLAWVQENVVWAWFCGFGFFGPWPNRNALYDFRQRVGAQIFEEVLTLVVQACLESGLVDNQLLAFDLTAVVASGHRWSPYERAVILTKALIRYLELCWAEQEPEELLPEALRRLAAEVALEVLPHKALEKVRPERVVESVAQGDDREAPWQGQMNEAVEEEHQQEEKAEESPAPRSSRTVTLRGSAIATLPLSDAAPEEVKARLVGVAKKLMERLPHSRGDLDARVGRTTSYTWFCGYLLGFVVDSLQHVITAVVLVAGNVKQARLLVPALEAHCQRVGVPEAVALDSAFDDKAQVYDYLDAQGIKGHVTSRDHATPAKGGYGTDRLTWDEKRGILRCPNGTPLRPIGPARPGPRTYEGTACSGCPVYDKCQPQGQGEAKQFSLDPVPHRRWQENRTHCQTEEYKVAQDRRFVEEGRFGLAKMNHHGAKAPYRSRAMNYLAALLIAIVMNYRILAQHQPEERRATL